MKSISQAMMIGKQAPDFVLQDERGKMVSLSDYKGQWIVLYFYPKDMTPGCSLEAEEFRDHEYEFDELNTVVLGVSMDSVESHQKFCSALNLNFIVLSDSQGEVCRLYDVLREKMMFGAKHLGIERTTFVINDRGIIRSIYDKVKPLGHAEKIINDLRKMQ